jgi:SAM-dependent methyltransferase
MGRFASTVEFYCRYREPYPVSFFEMLAERLDLNGNESLLDVGCGPALLAIGLAPFVGEVTAVDPETAMLDAARAAAFEAGAPIRFVHGRIEEFPTDRKFDLVTIGRALHWLDRDAALPILESIVPDGGRIVICGARSMDGPVASASVSDVVTESWHARYQDVRRGWSSEGYGYERGRHQDGRDWFAGSPFTPVDDLSLTEYRQVSVPELVGRALSKSNTSPEKLGERRGAFEAEITAAVEPFAQNDILQEQIVARATVFFKTFSASGSPFA